MDYNTDVSREFVDNLLESAMWAKGKVNVSQRVDEGTTSQEHYQAEAEEEQISFNYDDLQLVLDNLEDDVLMEHALSMLDVFDTAYETLLEGSDEYEEEEEEEYAEEEYYEDEEELDEESAAQKREKHLGARGMKTPKGGKGLHSRGQQQKRGEKQATTGGAPTRSTRSSS